MLDLWTAFYPDCGRGMAGSMNTSVLVPLSMVPGLPLITNAACILNRVLGSQTSEAMAGDFMLRGGVSFTRIW